MAPYKDPESLFYLTSFTLGNYIGSLVVSVREKFHCQEENTNAEESKYLQKFIKETTEHYDKDIPPLLHNIITFYSLTHIVSCWKSSSFSFPADKLPTANILDIAIRANTTKLDLSEWPYNFSIYISKSLRRLNKLQLLYLYSKEYIGGELEYNFIGIQDMKNLQSFVCENCNDAMLEVLCNNCSLKNLNISGHSVTDNSVEFLQKLQSLEILDICDTEISNKGCQHILLVLSNLINISYFNLSKVIVQINKNISLSLQYVEYICYRTKDVTNLINVCPAIKKLCISDCCLQSFIDFSDLAALKHLTSFGINKCAGFYKCNINTVLESQGYQITELELIEMDEISMEILYEVGTLCPNLKKLIVDNIYLERELDLQTKYKCLFSKLEYLDFNVCGYSDHHSFLLFILHNCKNITTVKYWSLYGISDEDFLNIFLFNPLEHLEELMFYTVDLTVESVYKLLSTCKKLQWIGYMKHWDKVTESELKQLHSYVKENYLNVELLYDDMDRERKHVSVMKSPGNEFCVMKRHSGLNDHFGMNQKFLVV